MKNSNTHQLSFFDFVRPLLFAKNIAKIESIIKNEFKKDIEDLSIDEITQILSIKIGNFNLFTHAFKINNIELINLLLKIAAKLPDKERKRIVNNDGEMYNAIYFLFNDEENIERNIALYNRLELLGIDIYHRASYTVNSVFKDVTVVQKTVTSTLFVAIQNWDDKYISVLLKDADITKISTHNIITQVGNNNNVVDNHFRNNIIALCLYYDEFGIIEEILDNYIAKNQTLTKAEQNIFKTAFILIFSSNYLFQKDKDGDKKTKEHFNRLITKIKESILFTSLYQEVEEEFNSKAFKDIRLFSSIYGVDSLSINALHLKLPAYFMNWFLLKNPLHHLCKINSENLYKYDLNIAWIVMQQFRMKNAGELPNAFGQSFIGKHLAYYDKTLESSILVTKYINNEFLRTCLEQTIIADYDIDMPKDSFPHIAYYCRENINSINNEFDHKIYYSLILEILFNHDVNYVRHNEKPAYFYIANEELRNKLLKFNKYYNAVRESDPSILFTDLEQLAFDYLAIKQDAKLTKNKSKSTKNRDENFYMARTELLNSLGDNKDTLKSNTYFRDKIKSISIESRIFKEIDGNLKSIASPCPIQ